MQLVQILLPSLRGERARLGFERVAQELTEKFGGATAYFNSPAEGIWDNEGVNERDLIVTVEIMVDDFDEAWWSEYRAELERRFRQREIVIRSTGMTKV
jgi:hypothetical protein